MRIRSLESSLSDDKVMSSNSSQRLINQIKIYEFELKALHILFLFICLYRLRAFGYEKNYAGNLVLDWFHIALLVRVFLLAKQLLRACLQRVRWY